MKVLIAGDGRSKIHEVSLHNGFVREGHQAELFKWHGFLKRSRFSLSKRVQEKLLLGPTIDYLNKCLLTAVEEFKPDLLFVYRGTVIKPSTLQKIKQKFPKIRVIGYNNDDPFAPQHSSFTWRLFKNSLKEYDLVYAYRPHNVQEYIDNGAQKSKLLMPWYCSDLHLPVQLTDEEVEKYSTSVVFIGHYEDDGRAELLLKLIKKGIDVKIFGPIGKKYSGWGGAVEKHPELRRLLPINMLWGREYAAAISAAKISVCFFSKFNRDKYTRRCFEIPSIGGFLLSEYSEELEQILKPDQEAAYFRNEEEFLQKVMFYLEHEDKRKQVAKAGHLTITGQGHNEMARATKVLSDVGMIT